MIPKSIDILKKYWGYEEFRPNQEEIIEAVLEGNDTIALLPTGGGKSVCYQVPVLMKEGIAIVISPLISLMHDQADNLNRIGVKSVALTSGMVYSDIDRELDNCVLGGYKFLFLSPERLKSDLVRERIRLMKVSLLVIDEAHCISQWGHDFRPSYTDIHEIKEFLPSSTPTLALTATANKYVLQDIQNNLYLNSPKLFRASFHRKNIAITISMSERPELEIFGYLKKSKGSVIIYVRNRRRTIEVAKLLNEEGFSADYFHGGLSPEDRRIKQKKWMDGQSQTMVATTAFGMGIDKPDVRLVFHLGLPENLESYYQEIGRAGRDGKPSKAVLFYKSDNLKRLYDDNILQFPSFEEVRLIYDDINNYFKIPINDGEGKPFEFDIIEFSNKYKYPLQKAIKGLQHLQVQKVLTLNNSQFLSSYIQIIIDPDNIENYKSRSFYDLLKVLIRSYGGITEIKTRIDEKSLAQRLNKPLEFIIDLLNQLKASKIIEYQEGKTASTIVFHQNRKESKYLNLDRKLYKVQKDERLRKYDYLKTFLNSKNICRVKLLLAYFDESISENCGNCDKCTKKSIKNIEGKILSALNQKSEIEIHELVKTIEAPHNEVVTCLRAMLDLGWIEKNGNRIRSKEM